MKRCLIMKKVFLLLVFFILTNLALSQDTSFMSVITLHEDLDLSEVDLVTIPAHGPYMLTGSMLSSLTEDGEMPELVFPNNMMVDDFIWTGKDFIVKSGYEIYRLDNLGAPLMDFDIADYEIYPLDERRIYAVSHQGDSSNLFLLNLKVKRAKHLLTIGEEIIYVSQLGEATMVVTAENIYLFNDKEKKCARYLKFWAPVYTAVMTHQGLMFATNNEICLLTGINQFLLMFETRTKKLLYDSNHLFIQLKEGDLLQCNLDEIAF